MEDEAAEEEDREAPDTSSVHPVVGRGDIGALIEQVLREGGAVGTGVVLDLSEVAEGAEDGDADGRDQRYRDREPRVLDITATRECREGVGDERTDNLEIC